MNRDMGRWKWVLALTSAASFSASVHHDHIGPAAGVNNAVAEIGGVLGIAVVALAFTGAGSFATPATVTHGFAAAIALCAVISLAGALMDLLAPRRQGPGSEQFIQSTPSPLNE